jgi:hypothetical protein
MLIAVTAANAIQPIDEQSPSAAIDQVRGIDTQQEPTQGDWPSQQAQFNMPTKELHIIDREPESR